jgi:hypothetical protein
MTTQSLDPLQWAIANLKDVLAGCPDVLVPIRILIALDDVFSAGRSLREGKSDAATARADEADEHARQQDERVARLVESIGLERQRTARLDKECTERARQHGRDAARVEALERFVADVRDSVTMRPGDAVQTIKQSLAVLSPASGPVKNCFTCMSVDNGATCPYKHVCKAPDWQNWEAPAAEPAKTCGSVTR